MFADVILPLAVPGLFTFAIPEGLGPIVPGVRVAVPFGKGGKLYGGLVRHVREQAPNVRTPRDILSVLDAQPVVTPEQMELWDRIAAHYLCTVGEVMIAALPAQLTLGSETRIVPNVTEGSRPPHDRRTAMIIDALERQEVLTMAQAGELLGLKDPLPVIKRMMDEGVVLLEEDLRDTWKPRTVTYVKLAEKAQREDALHEWFDRLEKKAPKQLHLLMRYVELSRCFSDAALEVSRDELLHRSDASSAVLKQLVEKGLFETYEREAGTPSTERMEKPGPELSEAQATALRELRTSFAEHAVVLLRGVTSSGKTELYTTLFDEITEADGQVLYLLPEIALTTQIIERLRARFGDRIAVYHSRMSQRDRTELWMRMVNDTDAPRIVVGARSALFLPFRRLQLVVVDEEHDPSYKQHDPAPRYNARDMAVVLASLHGARTLLGSATPSLESMFNAKTGKYGSVELLSRFGDVAMPTIQLVDLRDAQRRKSMRGHLSVQLIEALQQTLQRREQAILFQNRRGYVPVWQCEQCAWVPECDHCDVSLTYHKRQHQLRCHYCGRNYPPPTQCGQCGGMRLKMIGFGTEKIEEELAEFLPEARVARMDQDTTRGKQALDRIITGFAQGSIDILVGTQMVTKGLDFAHVRLVGILHADSLLRFPDFRAHERAFQLMAQVAGRAGRRKEAGTVLIQVHEVKNPVLGFVMEHDVEGMFAREIEHRKLHGYPPFTRLIALTLRHRNEERVAAAAADLAMALRERMGERVLGPDIPGVAWVKDRHLRKLLIKLRRSAHNEEKQFVRDTIDRLFAEPEHRAVQLITDVDPV
ncbi:MAG: primosomal protein N' [Flavobacteriales bacterium]|nr:primosomal protein N' [Flavobacteriales bacterium]MCC6939697.1 primosomal protein N' [Flavobacteriales bacterium]